MHRPQSKTLKRVQGILKSLVHSHRDPPQGPEPVSGPRPAAPIGAAVSFKFPPREHEAHPATPDRRDSGVNVEGNEQQQQRPTPSPVRTMSYGYTQTGSRHPKSKLAKALSGTIVQGPPTPFTLARLPATSTVSTQTGSNPNPSKAPSEASPPNDTRGSVSTPSLVATIDDATSANTTIRRPVSPPSVGETVNGALPQDIPQGPGPAQGSNDSATPPQTAGRHDPLKTANSVFDASCRLISQQLVHFQKISDQLEELIKGASLVSKPPVFAPVPDLPEPICPPTPVLAHATLRFAPELPIPSTLSSLYSSTPGPSSAPRVNKAASRLSQESTKGSPAHNIGSYGFPPTLLKSPAPQCIPQSPLPVPKITITPPPSDYAADTATKTGTQDFLATPAVTSSDSGLDDWDTVRAQPGSDIDSPPIFVDKGRGRASKVEDFIEPLADESDGCADLWRELVDNWPLVVSPGIRASVRQILGDPPAEGAQKRRMTEQIWDRGEPNKKGGDHDEDVAKKVVYGSQTGIVHNPHGDGSNRKTVIEADSEHDGDGKAVDRANRERDGHGGKTSAADGAKKAVRFVSIETIPKVRFGKALGAGGGEMRTPTKTKTNSDRDDDLSGYHSDAETEASKTSPAPKPKVEPQRRLRPPTPPPKPPTSVKRDGKQLKHVPLKCVHDVPPIEDLGYHTHVIL